MFYVQCLGLSGKLKPDLERQLSFWKETQVHLITWVTVVVQKWDLCGEKVKKKFESLALVIISKFEAENLNSLPTDSMGFQKFLLNVLICFGYGGKQFLMPVSSIRIPSPYFIQFYFSFGFCTVAAVSYKFTSNRFTTGRLLTAVTGFPFAPPSVMCLAVSSASKISVSMIWWQFMSPLFSLCGREWVSLHERIRSHEILCRNSAVFTV